MTDNTCGVEPVRLTKSEYEALGEESKNAYATQLRQFQLNCGLTRNHGSMLAKQ